jgi:hypothetical protein
MKGFGPKLLETVTVSFGICVTEPERHFVPESRLREKGQPDDYAIKSLPWSGALRPGKASRGMAGAARQGVVGYRRARYHDPVGLSIAHLVVQCLAT